MAGFPKFTVASTTALYIFIKAFGYVWGVIIASILFNSVSVQCIQEQPEPTCSWTLLSHLQLVSARPGVWQSSIRFRKQTMYDLVHDGLGGVGIAASSLSTEFEGHFVWARALQDS